MNASLAPFRPALYVAVVCAIAQTACFPESDGAMMAASACVDPRAVSVHALPSPIIVQSVACARGAASGDGSVDAPLVGLAAAATVAPGSTLVVLPGDYDEPVVLPPGVDLRAAGGGKVRLRGGLSVSGKGASHVHGVEVVGAVGVGVRVDGADVPLEAVRVTGTVAGAGKGPGHGVQVGGGGTLALLASEVSGSAGVGVLGKGAGLISIVEPIFDVGPRGEGGKVGIVEPIFSPKAQISANQGGGIAIVEPIFAPKGDAAGATGLLLRGAQVRDNKGFAVALYGADARIESSALQGTQRGAKGPFADGILIAAGKGDVISRVEVDAGSVIVGNARAGVVALDRADVTVAGDVSNNGHVGVWVAGADSVLRTTEAAVLVRNHLVGVCATGGATLAMTGGVVAETRPGAEGGDGLGDGIGVYDGARGFIEGTKVADNARAAVLIHAAATKSDGTPDVDIHGCAFVGGKFAIVVNGGSAPNYAEANSYSDSDQRGSGGTAGAPAPSDKSDADLPIADDVCADGEACAPEF